MAKLDLSQVIEAVTKKAANASTLLANGLTRLQDGINNLGSNLAADPVGATEAPPPLQSVNVKTASGTGEQVHVTFTHNDSIKKGVHYFLEYSNDPNFPQSPGPHVVHMGTSRGVVLNLPSKTDGGDVQNWYFRGYPQYPGSKPAAPVNYGGITPTAVTLGGSTQLTLQPSTGSGTAAANGQQGGYGFGKFNVRPAIGPKRSIPV
jgi:hypothetical protein